MPFRQIGHVSDRRAGQNARGWVPNQRQITCFRQQPVGIGLL